MSETLKIIVELAAEIKTLQNSRDLWVNMYNEKDQELKEAKTELAVLKTELAARKLAEGDV